MIPTILKKIVEQLYNFHFKNKNKISIAVNFTQDLQIAVYSLANISPIYDKIIIKLWRKALQLNSLASREKASRGPLFYEVYFLVACFNDFKYFYITSHINYT